MKRALITGITGQSGSYLAELLLSKGYEVHGTLRRSSTPNTWRIDHLLQPEEKIHLHYADMLDEGSLIRLLAKVQPDEVYNLAAQSHVHVSFEQPVYTADVVALGTLRLLEAVRQVNHKIRFYQASSSEMFGNSPAPQNEETPFRPRSPYAYAKVFAHQAAVNYREAYGMHVSCGILFNHESERRGEEFVTSKVCRGFVRIALGRQQELSLGNLDARRDWGFAGDYVKAMWLMLQQETPDDYVVGTGESHSVHELIIAAGLCTYGLTGVSAGGAVKFDARHARPAEVDHLCADPQKARRTLGWEPRVNFNALVYRMVRAEYDALCHTL